MLKNWKYFANIRNKRLLLLLLSMHIVFGIFVITETISYASSSSEIGNVNELRSNDSIQINSELNTSEPALSPVLLIPIDAVGENVYFVWSSNKTGNFEVYFARSTDSGENLDTAINLSNSPGVRSEDSLIKAEGKNVYVTWWENYGNGTTVPVARSSNDNGESFGRVVQLGRLIK
jgi:hypothetical protein